MRIVFICGSLEYGKDGVGDYTRRLAGELIRKGNQVQIVSLFDPFVKEVSISTQTIDNADVHALRISSQTKNTERISFLKKHLFDSPDVISLQYVPYSFHSKGIPLGLAGLLEKLGKCTKWHVMVHETYVKRNRVNLKNIITHFGQILSLKKIDFDLKPFWHTSSLYYKKMLAQINIQAEILGLFGNIAIEEGNNTEDLVPFKKNTDEKVMVYFGSAPLIQHHKVFSEKLKSFVLNDAQNLIILICGRLGKNGSLFKNNLNVNSERIRIIDLGEKTANEISAIFKIVDFGVSRVSLRLIGKSGTAISMLEHGLPLWVPIEEQEDEIYDNFRSELCYAKLEDLVKFGKKAPFLNRLPYIANQMINDIKLNQE
ncbi:MAG: hypothetical protein ACK4ND_17195 [Cytophagaceae bacterium]